MPKAARTREKRGENSVEGAGFAKILPFRASRCSCLGGFTSILTGTLNPLPTEAEEVHLARKKTESARSGRQGITFPIFLLCRWCLKILFLPRPLATQRLLFTKAISCLLETIHKILLYFPATTTHRDFKKPLLGDNTRPCKYLHLRVNAVDAACWDL